MPGWSRDNKNPLVEQDSRGAVRSVKTSVLLRAEVVRDGKAETTFGAAAGKNFAAVGCGHTKTETVFVYAFAV